MHRPIDRRLLRLVALPLALILIFGASSVGHSQDCDPEASLTKASDEFNAGHFYVLPNILKPCLDKGAFSKEQSIRAFQLLTQTYLILNDPVGAEQSYLNLLRANPEYVSTPDKDPIDVVYLSKKFTSTPIFSWYMQGGGNLIAPHVIQNNSINVGSAQKYTMKPGWQFGGGISWNANDQLTVETGLFANFSSYQYKETKIFVHDELTMIENQVSVRAPLSLKYTFIRRGISPFIYSGLSADMLLSAKQSYVFKNNTPNYNGTEIIGFASQTLERELNVGFRRHFLNRSVHIGFGARYKYKLNYFFADIRYSFGLNNAVVPANLLEGKSETSAFGAAYIDDYFRVNQVAVSIGFIGPWYKPRKLKNARTRSVLKTVNSDNDENNK